MRRDKALVIGGGLAGLVTARVLSEHFKEVIVIDRDEKIGSQEPRSGVKQGSHLHVLLTRGQKILKDLFPEIETLLAKNSPQIDWAEDTKWESRTGVFPRYKSTAKTYSLSRPFLEGIVYSLVSNIPNVRFVNEQVEKIRIENGKAIDADMTVLAGGQNFPIRRCLEDVEVPTSQIPIKITYRSVIFETASLAFQGFKQYYYQMTPPEDRLGAVICPIENGRSVATIVEYGTPNDLKTDLERFFEIAKHLPRNDFYNIIKNGRPLSEVSVFHKPTMYLRRPDKTPNFPKNVFFIGDVLCSLNPVFGQGMTSALIQANLLAEMCKADTLSDSRKFHRKAIRQIRLPYLLSKMGSNIEPGFSQKYLRSYLAECQVRPHLHKKFLGVLHLENSFGSLLDGNSLIAALGNKHD